MQWACGLTGQQCAGCCDTVRTISPLNPLRSAGTSFDSLARTQRPLPACCAFSPTPTTTTSWLPSPRTACTSTSGGWSRRGTRSAWCVRQRPRPSRPPARPAVRPLRGASRKCTRGRPWRSVAGLVCGWYVISADFVAKSIHSSSCRAGSYDCQLRYTDAPAQKGAPPESHLFLYTNHGRRGS